MELLQPANSHLLRHPSAAATYAQLRRVRDKQAVMSAGGCTAGELQQEISAAAIDRADIVAVERRDLVGDGGVAVSHQLLIPEPDPRKQ